MMEGERPPLWEHQVRALKEMATKPRAIIDLTMRSGKSRITIEFITSRPYEEATRILIICPHPVVQVWQNEFMKYALTPYVLAALDAGSVAAKRVQAQRCLEEGKSKSIPAICVINYQGVWRKPFGEWARLLPWSFLIFDEVHANAAPGSKQSRYNSLLSKQARRVYGLSGTPFPKGPESTYGVCRSIDSSLFGTNHLMHTRRYFVYGGYENRCQPAGTLIKTVKRGTTRGRPTVLEETPIEDITVGDRVYCYRSKETRFVPGEVLQKASRPYKGILIRVTTADGYTSRYTLDHLCFVSLKHVEGLYGVYIMRRGTQYRIGMSTMRPKHRRQSCGPISRMFSEGADAVWIAAVYKDINEAMLQEHILAGRYGLPELTFGKTTGDGPFWDAVWNGIGDNSDRAEKCLRDLGLDPRLPFVTAKRAQRYRRHFITAACNVFSGVSVLLPQFTPDRLPTQSGRHFATQNDWTPVEVTREYYSGVVHSLEVKDGLYVGDHIVTHNCIIAYTNIEEMRRKVASVRIHVRARDLRLPPVVETVVPLTLPTNARRIYEQLEEDYYARVSKGEVTAANAGVASVRLRQVCCGFVPIELADGHTMELQSVHTAKEDALRTILDGLPEREPVVVFANFRRDLARIHHVVNAMGRTSSELSGSFKTQNAWLAGQTDVLAAQIGAAAEGINLSRANYVIYYSINYNLVHYEQSRERVRIHDKPGSIGVYYLVMKGTVEPRIRRALSTRRNVIDELLRPPAEGENLRE